MAARDARMRSENSESGTNGVGKAPFALKLCPIRAVQIRTPPTYLDCLNDERSGKKNGFCSFWDPELPRPYLKGLFPRAAGGANHNLHLSPCSAG